MLPVPEARCCARRLLAGTPAHVPAYHRAKARNAASAMSAALLPATNAQRKNARMRSVTSANIEIRSAIGGKAGGAL